MTSAVAAPAVKILLVEDNPADADLIREVLDEVDAGAPGAVTFVVTHVDRLASGLARLEAGDIGVVLLDLSLPDSQGLATFLTMRERAPDTAVVVLSGLDDEVLAIRAVREGAQDYLVKGQADADLLARTLRYAIERKRAEADRAARAAVEAVLRARDELLATISHDLRSPLTTITGMSQLLLRRAARCGPDDLPRLIAGLTQIEAASDRMARLLDDLLDIARLEAGRPLELNSRTTDLVALVDSVVLRYRETTDAYIELEMMQPALVGTWDPFRLERVVENLLTNALKYSPAGSPITATVAQEDDAPGRWAVLTIRDRGIGIPAAELEQIFEPFHRAANVAGQGAGWGIGLAGVKQIVEQHRGRIAVVSEEGAGSAFTVRLPVEAETAVD